MAGKTYVSKNINNIFKSAHAASEVEEFLLAGM
jgi:hypothetical protein